MPTLEDLTQNSFRNKSNVKILRPPFFSTADKRKNSSKSKQPDFFMKQAYSNNF